MVIDDQLNILPVSSHTLSIKPVPPKSIVCMPLYLQLIIGGRVRF